VPGKPLGRHVLHDPRSLAYRVEADGTAKSVRWPRVVPVFDQGDIGSCTGNAAAGTLGTQPIYDTLPAGVELNEDEAVTLYSAATHLDAVRGIYPPDDTGSTGLAVAKACHKSGLISGYRHITSLAAAKTAIQAGPFITGTNWLTGMDEPDSDGRVHAQGSIRGGHEYEVIGYDAEADVWEFVNSWGDSFGKAGHFFMSSADYDALLHADGDATVLVPLTAPAPTPDPAPPADVVAQVVAKLNEILAWLRGLQG